MSFDDLARALAQPMPRRRALRLLGGAVAMAAVPGLGPQLARAGSKATCGPGTEPCSSANGLKLCMPTGGVCCYFSPETSGYTFGLLKGCAPGSRCGSGNPGDQCVCDGEYDFQSGRCVSAPCKGARKCGSKCCREGEVCKNAATSTCACLGGGEYCAPLNRCCDPGQRCEDGRCVSAPVQGSEEVRVEVLPRGRGVQERRDEHLRLPRRR